VPKSSRPPKGRANYKLKTFKKRSVRVKMLPMATSLPIRVGDIALSPNGSYVNPTLGLYSTVLCIVLNFTVHFRRDKSVRPRTESAPGFGVPSALKRRLSIGSRGRAIAGTTGRSANGGGVMNRPPVTPQCCFRVIQDGRKSGGA
jgi:hypothetical protein